jgi:pimeloyl-ACP methyl ester carboxylesterase
MVRARRLLVSCSVSFVLACADDGGPGNDEVAATQGSETRGDTSESGTSTSSGETSTGETGTGETSTSETGTSDETGTDTTTDDPEPPMLPLCGTTPPEGAELAPPLPTYGGICPTIDTSGPQLNYIDSGGGERSFMVVAPTDLAEDEVLPVMFMYHWLGGSADDFYERAQAQAAADYYRFIAIIPNGRDIDQLVPFKWPFAVSDLDFLMEQDFELFDDMLACVAEQFAVDKECVSTMGVSAGALFSSMLASRHGDALSSYISLSGGVGGLIKPWQPGGNIMPAMVLWGGDMDFCIAINFANTSKQLEMDLEANGHPVVECIHNCTHATPPLDPPPDMPDLPIFACTWEFMLAHPYWLDDGYSPYAQFDAMPSPFPEWCAYGAGNAVERVGECGGSECQ